MASSLQINGLVFERYELFKKTHFLSEKGNLPLQYILHEIIQSGKDNLKNQKTVIWSRLYVRSVKWIVVG